MDTENTEAFLEQSRENLNEILRPFQLELNRRQRLADFVRQCTRAAGRDDFMQLDELLKTKAAENIEEEPELADCKQWFDRLREYANEQVERYRLQFIEDLSRLAAESDLPIEIDFPRFSVLKGIEGEIDFSGRTTVINKKKLRSIDPRRIVTAALRVKRQLYDRPYDPQQYIDSLYEIYQKMIGRQDLSPGHPVPVQDFYLEYVLALQSKPFFTNMDKSKFRGYSLDQFVVDLWRYFESDVSGTSDGYVLQLRPGRNNSLWLIDSDGERRQITGISFQESE